MVRVEIEWSFHPRDELVQQRLSRADSTKVYCLSNTSEPFSRTAVRVCRPCKEKAAGVPRRAVQATSPSDRPSREAIQLDLMREEEPERRRQLDTMCCRSASETLQCWNHKGRGA